jgi:hypothetical protein
VKHRHTAPGIGGTGVPETGALGAEANGGFTGWPQEEQNTAPCAIAVPHFEQYILLLGINLPAGHSIACV